MGTYTANYQLYMPTVGEQGWGDLMNGNLTTIDTTMKSLSNSIGTLETETDAFDSRITAVETSITGGGSISNTGNITASGLITAKGGITGKINVSSVGTNSNNVKVCNLSATTQSANSQTGSKTITLSPSQVSVTRYNTSFLNCTLTNDQLKTKANATCTITVTHISNGNSFSCTVTVKTSSGTQIISSSQTIPAGGSKSWTFSRNFGTTYTVNISVIYGGNYSISTGAGTVYAG